jgi:hypothetical protein
VERSGDIPSFRYAQQSRKSRHAGQMIPMFAAPRPVYQPSECVLVHCANQTHT